MLPTGKPNAGRIGRPALHRSSGFTAEKTAFRSGMVVTIRAGWRFRGEFRRGRDEPIALECIVAIRDRLEAKALACKSLIGAEVITASAV